MRLQVCQYEAVAAGIVPRWQARWLLGIQLPLGRAPRQARGNLFARRQYLMAAAAAAAAAAALLAMAVGRGDGGEQGGILSWMAELLSLEGELQRFDVVDTAGFAI